MSTENLDDRAGSTDDAGVEPVEDRLDHATANLVYGDDERWAVEQYSIGKVRDNWVYYLVNSYLRAAAVGGAGMRMSRAEQRVVHAVIEGVGRGFERWALNEPVMVYRGLHGLQAFGVHARADLDAESLGRLTHKVAYGGFLSTTAARDVADQFANRHDIEVDVLMTLEVPRGTPAIWMPKVLGNDLLVDQKELLLADDCAVQIVEAERRASGRVELRCQIL